jgi:lipoprotein-anchoring transpeptidase ErfK/SrfK
VRVALLLVPTLLVGGAVVADAVVPATRAHSRPHAAKAVVPAPLPAGRFRLTAKQAHEAFATGHYARPIATLLDIQAPLRFGEYRWNDADVPANPTWVSIDLQRQLISVFRGPHEIGSAVILFGAQTRETPVGTFPILAKLKHHRSITYGNAPMPYTLRLTADGVSIHGSNVRDGYATHGCIGVPVDFAAKLFDAVSRGDKVIIADPQPGRKA